MEEKEEKKKKRWPWIVGAIVLVVAIAGFFGGNKSDTGNTAQTNSASQTQANKGEQANKADQKKEDETYAIGKEFTVGDWAVTVVSVDAPVPDVGKSEYIEGAKAQGQFIPVKIKAKNNGSKGATFFADNVKLKDSEGKEFSYSSDAAIWGAEKGGLILEDVNPGNTVEGMLWFDTPAGANISELVFSGGLLDKSVSVPVK